MNPHDFYVTPGPMTDVSSCAPELLEDLPTRPVDLMKVVRGCVTNELLLREVHKVTVPDRNDAGIRPASQVIARLASIDPSPLVHERAPLDRFIGNCRHFATLACALLRRAGIPVRVRAGFASYFIADTWVDHWIVEYKRDDRWVRVDPELDDEQLARQTPTLTSERLASTQYLSGTEAWRKIRRGEEDPDRFTMGTENWGIGEIRGSVLFDFAALNKDEVLPWDSWGQMEAAYKSETDEAYDMLLDQVSELAASDDLEAVRALYESHGDLKVPMHISGRD